MKKIKYENVACEVSVVENFHFLSEVDCEYEKDTVAYAVELFFAQSSRFRRECSYECWQLRTLKGKARQPRKFTYLIPALLMELPGTWVRLTGEINPVGVKIKKVELLEDYPCYNTAA